MTEQLPQPLAGAMLYTGVDPALFDFTTTAELSNGTEIVGQDRAVDAIRFGIGIRHPGYNLYALGPDGTGKHTLVSRFLAEQAPTDPRPNDWCYVYNFDQPYRPQALSFPAGEVAAFAQAMEHLVEELQTVLPATFISEEYQARRRAIEEEIRGMHSEAIDQLREKALQHSVALLQTPNGWAFAPLKGEGEVISPDEFVRMPAEEQKRIETEIVSLQDELQKIMRMVPGWQRDMQARTKALDEEVAGFAISSLFEELRATYANHQAVLDYLEAARKDVVRNFSAFLPEDESESKQLISAALGLASSAPSSHPTRYAVNIMVDNGPTVGAPIVDLDQPRYQNLVGRVEHIAQMGALVTDFTLIKPGALHQANGGYLVIEARRLLMESFSYETLKRVLRQREIAIESLGQMYSLVSTVSLEPEPIPLNVKVILVGDRQLYYLLAHYDPEFTEYFKVAADFEDEVARSPEIYRTFARVLAAMGRNQGLRPLDRAAVARIIEHGSRMIGDAERMSTHMQSISDVTLEADYWAGRAGRDVITREDIQQALAKKLYRSGRISERIKESILREFVLVDTAGGVVGQVNGLSVYTLGDTMFGRPSRITARVRLGRGEVIDIERQVEMGGPIHSKGVMILAAFLGARYAASQPLSLSATLAFEQSYGPIDGDSASSAELYALLSALSEVAISQNFAVTGSVNQRGQVQVIGGVNEKIEGFFDLCAARGLTGDQGVLIPAGNVKSLMLRHDVIEAVERGEFAIYPVSTIDEGISLLTGVAAGEVGPDGVYPPDSINGRVVARLVELAEKQRAFARQDNEAGRNEGKK